MTYFLEKIPRLSPDMKMADLVNGGTAFLTVVHRFGIPFGFGEKTVEECCREQGRDAFTLLSVAGLYFSPFHEIQEKTLAKLHLKDIEFFLERSHESYRNEWIPNIAAGLDRSMAGRDENKKKIIDKFFSDFKEELEGHVKFEETKLYPLLEAFAEGKKPQGRVRLVKEHDNIVNKIQDLINIVMKYLPSDGKGDASMSWILLHLSTLREDLERHSNLEDMLILPLLKGRLAGKENE
jgi:regulator of cell morphogenesis and NO signaling